MAIDFAHYNIIILKMVQNVTGVNIIQ